MKKEEIAQIENMRYEQSVFNLLFGGWGGYVMLIEELPNGDTAIVKQYNTPICKHPEKCQQIIDDFIIKHPIDYEKVE